MTPKAENSRRVPTTRWFKIDEQNWADLDGEVVVYLPANLAALVGQDDRVTVTGTMKALMKGDLQRERSDGSNQIPT